jgi:hypothetical protein
LLFSSTSSWPVNFFLARLIAIFALVGFFLASLVNYYLPMGAVPVFAAGLVGFFPAGLVNVSPAVPASVFSPLDFFPGRAG